MFIHQAVTLLFQFQPTHGSVTTGTIGAFQVRNELNFLINVTSPFQGLEIPMFATCLLSHVHCMITHSVTTVLLKPQIKEITHTYRFCLHHQLNGNRYYFCACYNSAQPFTTIIVWWYFSSPGDQRSSSRFRTVAEHLCDFCYLVCPYLMNMNNYFHQNMYLWQLMFKHTPEFTHTAHGLLLRWKCRRVRVVSWSKWPFHFWLLRFSWT